MSGSSCPAINSLCLSASSLEDLDWAVLSLHRLQVARDHVTTLLLQQVSAGPLWLNRMSAEDYRDVSAWIFAPVNPYGWCRLNIG